MHNNPSNISPYNRLWLTLSLLIMGLVGVVAHSHWTTPPSEAAVELVSFTATAENNNSEVRLRWETAVEMDTAGYRLQRSDLGDTFITVTYLDEEVSFIPGDPTGLGAIYIAQDTAVTTGNTYIYTLIEIDNSSVQEEIATAVVNLGGGNSQPTNTPTATATNTPTPTATGIVNLAPTNTPTPRTQASPTQTNTPPPPTATTPPTPVPTTASTNTSTTANNDNGTTNNSNSSGSNSNSSTDNTATGSNNSSTNTGASVAQASETQQEATPSTSSNNGNNDNSTPTPDPDTPEEATREEPNATPDLTQPDDDTAQPESSPYPENDNTANDPTGYQEGQPLEQQPAVTSESSENVVPLGAGNNQNNNTQPNASTTSTNNSGNSNNWILWGAFLGALAIFIAGIAGSILLFMRRR